MESVLAALITGGLALVGIIITNISNNRRIEAKIVTAQAVTDVKLDTLTEEVRKHNNFASRVPVIEEQVKSMNHRITDVEEELKKK